MWNKGRTDFGIPHKIFRSHTLLLFTTLKLHNNIKNMKNMYEKIITNFHSAHGLLWDNLNLLILSK